MPSPRYPSLYEINTRVWLSRLSQDAGRPITLADIDDAILDDFEHRGFDWIWLLSVWQTGVASRTVSRTNPAWQAEFRLTLPDLTEADICGSGFAIGAYEVDEALGGKAALAQFRARLAKRGLRLMLDFVANHTALDHHWVKAHPDFYVQGSEQALAAEPDHYCRVETDQGTRILAYGRDPNFPGWPDTLQLDYTNPILQAAQMAELATVAEQCDGVRCDMAMLLLPEVFQRTWGRTPAPFWPKAIGAMREACGDFTFLAEAYWDLEWELLQQGFDYCYDKRLYDRLRGADATSIRDHLAAGPDYQARLARFLENHDEPRAARIFTPEQHRAAAIVTYLSSGLRFFHQGQLAGMRTHIPTHLCRAPIESPDASAVSFYYGLQSIISTGDAFRDGTWTPVAPQPAWPDNPTWRDFIACAWAGGDGIRYVVTVNYANHQGQCRLSLPFEDMDDAPLRLVDVMGIEIHIRHGRELTAPGLYLDVAPWHYNVFRLDRLNDLATR